MRRILAIVLIAIAAAAIASILFLPDGSDQPHEQSSPHAIDQGE